MNTHLNHLINKPSDSSFATIFWSIALLFLIVIGALLGFNYWSGYEKARMAAASAQDHYRKGEYNLAETKIAEALKYHKTAKNFHLQSQIQIEQDRLNEALESINQAIKRDKNNHNYHFQAGKLESTLGDYEAAIGRFKQAIHLSPKNLDYQLALGNVYMRMGNKDQALKTFKEVLKTDHKNENAWGSLITIYNRKEQRDKALKVALQATKEIPNSADLYYALGLQYAILKKPKEAVQALKRAIELDPNIDAEELIAAISNGSFYESSTDTTEKKEYTIPIKIINNHAFVEVSINGYRGNFLIDTGASQTCVFQQFLNKYEINLDFTNSMAQYQTAGGLIEAKTAYANLKLDRLSFAKSKVAILKDNSEPFDGVLGMDILSKYNTQIDSSHHLLILSQK
jgi:tetratricopeptide (TPR) repeat protein